jgi:pimeloyl-ACP methyl ester carboxylesterase
MRRAERILAWSCVAAALFGGCKRWRGGGEDAGVPDAGPRGPAVVQLAPTEERWQWVGTLYPGAEGTTGAVLLLHQLGSNREEWRPLIDRLKLAPAITVLSLDLRGHGDSVRGPQSDRQTWEGFGEDPARWAGLPRDAVAGARYLFNEGAARSVVVVGSSIGASAAVAGLADEPRVVGLAMISPGLAYHGLDALGPMRAYAVLPTTPPRTAWMMAAERDEESARALATLATEAAGIAVERAVVPASDAHGVSLLNADPARWDALERYVRTVLRAPRRSAVGGH